MLFVELLGDPDNHLRLQAGQIGQHLAKVLEIRVCELVLDEDPSAIGRIVGNDVRTVRPHLDFTALEVQVKANHLGKAVQVLGEPRREVVCFVGPRFSQVGGNELPQL